MIGYEQAANELTNRILALIPEHQEILTMDSVWCLFMVPGFKCDDLSPSLAQAQLSLEKARELYGRSEEVP